MFEAKGQGLIRAAGRHIYARSHGQVHQLSQALPVRALAQRFADRALQERPHHRVAFIYRTREPLGGGIEFATGGVESAQPIDTP